MLLSIDEKSNEKTRTNLPLIMDIIIYKQNGNHFAGVGGGGRRWVWVWVKCGVWVGGCFFFQYIFFVENSYISRVKYLWSMFDRAQLTHYDDFIMTTMAAQITSLTVVYSTVYSDANQKRKHQSSASLAFVWGIHRDRWIPRTKGQLRGQCFHLMTSSCIGQQWFTWSIFGTYPFAECLMLQTMHGNSENPSSFCRRYKYLFINPSKPCDAYILSVDFCGRWHIFAQENSFENVVWKIAASLCYFIEVKWRIFASVI